MKVGPSGGNALGLVHTYLPLTLKLLLEFNSCSIGRLPDSMADEDLEWGSYVNLLQTIHSLTPDVVNDFAPLFPDSFGLAANSSTAKSLKEPRQQENSPRDDSIISRFLGSSWSNL